MSWSADVYMAVRPLIEKGVPFAIGINGLDCAGKTTLAHQLQEYLIEQGQPSILLHIDDFNNFERQKELYNAYSNGDFGAAELDQYYNESVRYDALADAILKSKETNKITIVEGVFLYKPDMKDIFEHRIMVEVDPSVGFERYKERKAQVGDTRPSTVFTDIWVPAFNRYVQENSPAALSHQVFTFS